MTVFSKYMKRSKRTVAGDLLVWLSWLTAIIVLAIGLAYYGYSHSAIQTQIREDHHRTVEDLSKVLEQPLFTMDNEGVVRIIEIYRASGRIRGARVVHAHGIAVYDNLHLVPENAPRVEFPISGSGLNLGEVTVAFNDSPYAAAEREILRTMVFGFLVFLVVNIGLIRWILRSILNPPLQQLDHRLQAIAAGEYGGHLQPDPHEEINRVVEAVNRLSDELSSRTRRLTESEQTYKVIFNSTSDCLFVQDPVTGAFLDVNDAVNKQYGYSREEMLRLSVSDLSANEGPFTQAEALARIHKAAAGEPQIFPWPSKRRNGERFWVEVALSLITMGGRGVVLAVARDITERRRVEHELHQSQKIEAIGTLAGGIAHDFNNILSGIMGYTELARGESEANKRLSLYLQRIEHASIRARDLIRQILTFSRKGEVQPQVVELTSIAAEAWTLLRSTIPASIRLKQEIEAHCCVFADPTQIHQVIMNLCTNAWHAMEEKGGVLTLRIYEVRLEEPDEENNAPAGAYALLEVSDTGIGMDEHIKARIFDPYFTTKRGGKGTGLGLSVVHGIVRNAGGRIAVQSAPGAGTTFSVWLPLVEPQARAEQPNTVEVDTPSGGNIIVVDDEESIRTSTKAFLEKKGYRVECFEDAETALEYLREDPGCCDLILTDLAMPGMSGIELARIVRNFAPGMPVILCTGYNAGLTQEMRENVPGEPVIALQKPLLMMELQNEIARMLVRTEPRRTA